MRILVTGVTGQVGGALASRLSRQWGARHELVAASREVLDLSEPAAIADRLEELAPARMEPSWLKRCRAHHRLIQRPTS